MLIFSPRRPPAIIIIDGASVVMGDQLQVDTLWCAGTNNETEVLQYIARAVSVSNRPLDTALIQFLDSKHQSLPVHIPVHHSAITPVSCVSGNVWHHGAEFQLALIGLPEKILARADLTENEREAATIQLHKLAAAGHSVVAIGYATMQKAPQANETYDQQTVSLAGFVSLRHTISPHVRQLIGQALERGARLRLITGAHRHTAYHIARQLGMVSHQSQLIDAPQFSVMPEAAQRSAIRSVVVFTRAAPDQKEQLIARMTEAEPQTIVVTNLSELKSALG